MTTEPPVTDAADFVTAFMSLPEVLQQAALMTIYAARDLTEHDHATLPRVLDTLGNLEVVPDTATHYLSMVNNVLTATRIASFQQ